MRNKTIHRLSILIIIFSTIIYTPVFAFDPPSPPPLGETGDQPPGGSAPINGGAIFFVAFALGYAIIKLKHKSFRNLSE